MLRLRSTAIVASMAWAAAAGAATAHHSFAMFDAEHPIDITGTVKEFRFVSPHTILIVDVKGEDGSIKSWILEGGAPGLQAREGSPATKSSSGSIRCTAAPRAAPTSRHRSSSRTDARSWCQDSGPTARRRPRRIRFAQEVERRSTLHYVRTAMPMRRPAASGTGRREWDAFISASRAATCEGKAAVFLACTST
jgi:hypothetical protein